jgi:hypothetical protein
MEMTHAAGLKRDLELAQRGVKQNDPRRQTLLRAIPGLLAVAGAIALQMAEPNIPAPEERIRTEQTAPEGRRSGQVLVIGQHHFEVEETNKALGALQKAGAEYFAIELPENFSKAINQYLESPRTEDDKINLTSKTFLEAQLNPVWIEEKRRMRESMLRSMGSNERVDTQTMIDLAFEEFYENPNQWVGAAKVALEMMEKAHDAGLKVVCIDINPIKLLSGDWEGLSGESFLRRNREMAKNLVKLSGTGKHTIAAVGAAHTGRGNKTSVEETARRLGVPCKSIDTFLPREEYKSKIQVINDMESLASADSFALRSSDIVNAFQKMVKPKEKSQEPVMQ